MGRDVKMILHSFGSGSAGLGRAGLGAMVGEMMSEV